MSFVILPKEIMRNKHLSNTDKMTYLAIKSFMNENSKRCFPSRKQISEIVGVSTRSITTSITKLHSHGCFQVERQHNGSNIYRFM